MGLRLSEAISGDAQERMGVYGGGLGSLGVNSFGFPAPSGLSAQPMTVPGIDPTSEHTPVLPIARQPMRGAVRQEQEPPIIPPWVPTLILVGVGAGFLWWLLNRNQ